MRDDDADVIVVGGGPAGAAAACVLAEAGCGVLVLEREAGPHHKVCGEFVSIEAAWHLEGLGIDLAALGAEPVEAVRLIAGGKVACAPLPFPAHGLSRRRLDEALLARAEALGAQIRRGVAAREIEPAQTRGGAVRVRLGDGTLLAAGRAVFLATGKHDLRGRTRPAPARRDSLIGFKMHFRLGSGGAALNRHVELHLYDGFYAGLQRIEQEIANLCLLLPSAFHARLDRNWDRVLDRLKEASPPLAERLDGAEPLWERPLAVARIPYGYVQSPADTSEPGIWRLGDQAAVTPSFTGDGLAIALHTARSAARIFLAGGGEAEHRAALNRDVRGQVIRSTLLARALLSGPVQPAILGAARIWPGLLRAGASLTRLSPAAVRRAA